MISEPLISIARTFLSPSFYFAGCDGEAVNWRSGREGEGQGADGGAYCSREDCEGCSAQCADEGWWLPIFVRGA